MIKILHHLRQHQAHLKTRVSRFIFFWVLVLLILYPVSYIYAALSCSVVTQASCNSSGYTTILRMSGTTNAHGELPSESNANYASNVVCCNSPSAIGNSCTGNYKVVSKISAVTNSHMQESSVNTYGTNVCLSDTSTGDTITTGYQNTNCSGYDTTLLSMSASDNATIGDGTAYTRKVCATITPLVITFSISANTVNFGTLSSSASRYANTSTGSATEVEAHTISASTNAGGGYTITVNGNTLTSGANTIDAIGSTNTAPSVGSKQFGLRANVTSGTGSVTAPYAASGFALDTGSMPSQVASGTGDSSTTIYSVRYLGNITTLTPAGSYSSNLNYVVTATF